MCGQESETVLLRFEPSTVGFVLMRDDNNNNNNNNNINNIRTYTRHSLLISIRRHRKNKNEVKYCIIVQSSSNRQFLFVFCIKVLFTIQLFSTSVLVFVSGCLVFPAIFLSVCKSPFGLISQVCYQYLG